MIIVNAKLTQTTDNSSKSYWSLNHFYFFAVAAPEQPPISISTGDIRRTSINITWGPVPEGSSLVPITGYMVWYREHLPSPSSAANITIQINDSMSCLIEGLKEYTEYDIRVAALNRAGVGVYSTQMVVRTAEGREY